MFLVYLDADFMGLGWCYLHLLDGKRLPRFPGNSCLALDHLRTKHNMLLIYYFNEVCKYSCWWTETSQCL